MTGRLPNHAFIYTRAISLPKKNIRCGIVTTALVMANGSLILMITQHKYELTILQNYRSKEIVGLPQLSTTEYGMGSPYNTSLRISTSCLTQVREKAKKLYLNVNLLILRSLPMNLTMVITTLMKMVTLTKVKNQQDQDARER